MMDRTPITGEQVLAARAVLGIDRNQLSIMAGVGVETIRRFEGGESVRPATMAVIRHMLEICGIIFADNGKGISWEKARWEK
jgi:hypothetical protein